MTSGQGIQTGACSTGKVLTTFSCNLDHKIAYKDHCKQLNGDSNLHH